LPSAAIAGVKVLAHCFQFDFLDGRDKNTQSGASSTKSDWTCRQRLYLTGKAVHKPSYALLPDPATPCISANRRLAQTPTLTVDQVEWKTSGFKGLGGEALINPIRPKERTNLEF
jgi:hypothetical protein